MPGQLTVVGTGLRPAAHCSRETLDRLRAAECLLYPAEDPAGSWLQGVNPRAQACLSLKASVLEALPGQSVCAAFHGHPAAFRRVSHELLAEARARGHDATMLAAVWAEDCLCADLEVDPLDGWQAYEAANFLLHGRSWSPQRALLLWRVAAVWERDAVHCPVRRRCLAILGHHLVQVYGPEHEAVLYDPPGSGRRLSLADLAQATLTPATALYIPPLGRTCGLPQAAAQLTLAGSGMEPGHVTLETQQAVAASDVVFYVDEQARGWLGREAQGLTTEALEEALGQGLIATVVVPGHPAMGSFVRALSQAARARGYTSRLLASISPLGMLYAQLGFNPADGCQVFRGVLPADWDSSAPALLVSEQGWVQPVSPERVAQPDPPMLERLTVAAARENTEELLQRLSDKDREALDSLVFDRQRSLADDLGLPSVKRLKPEAAELIWFRATMDFSTDRILELCQGLGLDATSPGALLAHAAAHPDSELARMAWLNAYSRKAWESL